MFRLRIRKHGAGPYDWQQVFVGIASLCYSLVTAKGKDKIRTHLFGSAVYLKFLNKVFMRDGSLLGGGASCRKHCV